MKEIMFENKEEIIQASEDYLRPLIGRKLRGNEKEMVYHFFIHYFDLENKEDEEILMSERKWLIYQNRLMILFDDQIKLFDSILDGIVLLKSKDPNVIFGYSEEYGAKVDRLEGFDNYL